MTGVEMSSIPIGTVCMVRETRRGDRVALIKTGWHLGNGRVTTCGKRDGPWYLTERAPQKVSAIVARDGRKTLVARPRSGQVRIHEDCWGDDLTCQRTRAGGVYNSSPSIYDWFARSR
jgi:hypothetical protein